MEVAMWGMILRRVVLTLAVVLVTLFCKEINPTYSTKDLLASNVTNCIRENSSPNASAVGQRFQDELLSAMQCLSDTGIDDKSWLIVTGADWGYRGVLYNWILHMEKLSISNYVILCYDERIYQEIGSVHSGGHGVLVPNCNTDTVHRSSTGVRTSVSMTQKMLMKHVAVGGIISRGLTAVWSDVDALWLSHFLTVPVLRTWSRGDIVGQMGIFPDSVFLKKGVALCSGLFAVFPSATSRAFYSRLLLTIQEPGRFQSDQLALNELLDVTGAFDYLLPNISLADALPVYDLPFKHFDRKRYDNEFIAGRQAARHTVLFSDPPHGVMKVGLLPFTKFPREKTRHWKMIWTNFQPSIYHMFSMKNGTKKVQEFENDGVLLLAAGWELSSNSTPFIKRMVDCAV